MYIYIVVKHEVISCAGKYIGNRPMKLRKSTWKDRGFLEVKKKEKAKKRLGFKV